MLTYTFKMGYIFAPWIEDFKQMPARKKGYRKVMIYVRPEFWDEVKKESIQRKIPLGELVEEAFMSRVRIIRK